MGTQAAPNLVLSIIDLADGSLDSGKTVEIVAYGGAYPGDAIALAEIGSTGRYKKETASGEDSVTQGIYSVYVGGTLNGVFIHGYEGLAEHLNNTSNPHSVVAAQVNLTDTGGYFTTDNVEAALQAIAAALAEKADIGNAILTASDEQSVSSSKPVVANLNADKLDGYHAGNNANQIPVLTAAGKLLASIIPANLPDVSAGKVGGKTVGSGSNSIPVLSANLVEGKLHTSLLGKKVGNVADAIPLLGVGSTNIRITVLGKEVGASNNNLPQLTSEGDDSKLSTSLLGKAVGVANNNIPQISTEATPGVGKIHESILGRMAGSGRMATYNQSDVPAPNKYGGGILWFEVALGAADTDLRVLDNSIDWRDRFVNVWGFLTSENNNSIPGAAGEQNTAYSRSFTGFETMPYFVVGSFYTAEGADSWGALYPGMSLYSDISSGEGGIGFRASAAGVLQFQKLTATIPTPYSGWLQIAYSPVQNHV